MRGRGWDRSTGGSLTLGVLRSQMSVETSGVVEEQSVMESHMILAVTITNGRSPSCEAIPGTDGEYLHQGLKAVMTPLVHEEVCHRVIHAGCLLQETSKATP
jgi:hypothetical protein